MRVSLHSNAGCIAKGVVLECDARERLQIGALLASGLETEAVLRADTREQVQAIIARLREAPDLNSKLVIAGFTDHPVVPALRVRPRINHGVGLASIFIQ